VGFVLVSPAVTKAVRRRVVSMLICMGFMVRKVALGASFTASFLLTRVSVIPRMIQTQLQLQVSLPRTTDGRSVGNNWQTD